LEYLDTFNEILVAAFNGSPELADVHSGKFVPSNLCAFREINTS
jgi:hypothetical protein